MKPTWEREGIRMANIYALIDPRSCEVRYVGATVSAVTRRLICHIHDSTRAKSHLPVATWLRELKELGLRPKWQLLGVAEFGKESEALESMWIAHYRTHSEQLLNQTDGGYGLRGHRFQQSHRDRIAASLNKQVDVACEYCGAAFRVKPYAVRKGNGKFCSKACYIDWQRGRTKAMPKRGTTWNKGIPRTPEERLKMSIAKRLANQARKAAAQ